LVWFSTTPLARQRGFLFVGVVAAAILAAVEGGILPPGKKFRIAGDSQKIMRAEGCGAFLSAGPEDRLYLRPGDMALQKASFSA